MSAITVFKRYEKKYLMDEAVMNRLLPVIMEHMEADRFCADGSTYSICNLYFDTDGFDVIRESLSKPFYKEKLRMRSYGLPQSPEDRVFLEMKKKINRLVTKRRVSLTLKEAVGFMISREYPAEASYMTLQVLKEIDYYLSCKKVSPSMRIEYDRLGFFDREDSGFRLTFDKNLTFLKDPKGFDDKDRGRQLMPDDFRLMEVKVSEAMPLWFTELLSKEEVYTSSFSKYGVAYKSYLKEEVLEDSETINILSRI